MATKNFQLLSHTYYELPREDEKSSEDDPLSLRKGEDSNYEIRIIQSTDKIRSGH